MIVMIFRTYEKITVGTRSYETLAFLYSSEPNKRSESLLPAAIAYCSNTK